MRILRQSLSPVADMAEQARRMSAGNIDGRLPVANPRGELGRLAATVTADRRGRVDGELDARMPGGPASR